MLNYLVGMDIAKLAYLAGLFDGEGSVSMAHRYKGKHKTGGPGTWFQLTVVIRNRNRECLELAQELFGGSINVQRFKSKGWADCYRWQAGAKVGIAFLQAINPYVIIKRPQIDAVLNNLEDKGKVSELLTTFNRRGQFKGTQLPL